MKYSLLQDGLEYWRRCTPQKFAVAIDDHNNALTYEELGRWSDGIAGQLRALGVIAGDNVAITGANSLNWVAAAFGVLKAGATIVPYNERFVRDEMAYLVNFSEPRVIIADRPRAEIIDSLNTGLPILLMEQLNEYKVGAEPGWQPVRVAPDSLAMVIFTSGTTGRPKGVMLSHEQHLNKFSEYVLCVPDVSPSSRIFMPLAIHAAPGTAWGYMLSSVIGATAYFTQKFDAARALKTLVDCRITMLLGVPLICERIMMLPDFAEADLSTLAFAQVGGSRISAEMLEAWNNKGVSVRSLYGMTETGGVGIVATPEEARAKPNACGRGMMFTKVRVVRTDGSDAAPNEPGSVSIRGPGMMVGYWRNPEATAQALIDGWMHTGDIGALDEEGYFVFIDRSKDMIISGGFNISPSEVEAVIAQLDSIIEVAVIPVADEKFGETPCALVHTSVPIDTNEIFSHCCGRLAGFKLPRYIVQHEAPLPRMTSGKIDKRKLVADHADVPDRYPRHG